MKNLRVGDKCRLRYADGSLSVYIYEVRKIEDNNIICWRYCGEWSRYVTLNADDAANLEPGEKAEWLPYAEWIRKDDAEIVDGCYIPNFVCSRCNDWLREESDFCPSCGAKMRKER